VLHHVTRGFWSVSKPADEVDAHLLRTISILRRQVTATAATAHSALVLWGLPIVDSNLDVVHVQRATSRTTRRGAGYTVHSPEAATRVMTRPPVISEEVPVVDLGAAIVLSGITGSPDGALVAADAAVRARLITPRQIEVAAATKHRGAKGIGAVRRALALVDGRRESAGESLTARTCAGLGYVLEPQVWIGPWRVDFLIQGTTVIIEFDGAVKYTSRGDLLAEKQREDDLRRRGYVVVRLMWADVRVPARARAKIEAGLAAAA
jgi:very-short-patch-repair endonuclease